MRGRRDNRTQAPARPFGVTEDELERALRETLAGQVSVPRPLAADPAVVAIRRAGRAQRRRTFAGLALAAVATVTVSTGMAQLGQDSGRPIHPTVVLGDPYASALPTPTPMLSARAAPGGPQVDLILGDVLATAGGRRLALTGVGPVERAQRLPGGGGWLVVGTPTVAGRSLWAVTSDGTTQVLLAGAAEITLTPDGRQVAWRQGAELVAAGIVGSQLVAATRTPAPAGAVPVDFVGDTVLVRRHPDRPGHTLWRPALGALGSGGDRASLRVYGARPDGLLVGEVTAGTPRQACLALLDPARDLAPVRTGCGPALSADGYGAVSLDGRWLLVNGRSGGKESALLVDLDRLDPTPVTRPAGPPIQGAVAWTRQGTAVYPDPAGGLVRAEVGRVLAGERASASPVDALRGWERPVPVTGNEF